MNKLFFTILIFVLSVLPVSALQLFSKNDVEATLPQEESAEEGVQEDEEMVDPLEMSELLPQELPMDETERAHP